MPINRFDNFNGSLRGRNRGAVLLEVVLAMSLFFMTATFVMNGLNGSMGAVSTAKLEADAADLAVTVLSEVQLGLIPLNSDGPVAIDLKGYEGWAWQLVVEDSQNTTDLPELKQIAIVIRHDDEDFTHRTSHLLWNNPNRGAAPAEDPALNELGIPDELGNLPGVLP